MMKVARFLLSNLFTLLLSLSLAVLIWVNASQTEDPIEDRWIQIPIEYVGQPADSILLSTKRQNAQIFFQSRASIMPDIGANDFTAVVDLSQAPFGQEHPVEVQVRSKNPEVAVLSQPEPVTVLLEQLVSKDIPVELDIRGSVARGHVQGEPLMEPDFITISGPASSVNRIDRGSATVFLNSDRETKIDSIAPIFYDRQGRVASVSSFTLSSDQIEVTIPVNESANFAERFISIDLVGEPAPGYRLLSAKTEPSSVLIQGPPTQIEALTRLRTDPVDITGLTESLRQKVALVLPGGVTLDEVVEIYVDVQIEPFLTTRPYNQQLLLQGLGENLEAVVDPEEVRVVLFGPLPILETLLDEEVRVTVDLFDLGTGIYSLEPAVTFPDRGVELRSIQPSLVTVNITRIITMTNEVTDTLTVTDSTSSLLPNYIVPAAGKDSSSQISWQLLHGASTPLHLPKRDYL